MGLDQFLSAKKYIGGNYEHNGITGSIKIYKQPVTPNRITHQYELSGKKTAVLNLSDMSKVSGIEFAVAYWRKANAIHKWFVDNVQDGVDNCGEYYVSRAQLEELVRLCHQVLGNELSADDTLPTTSGFFFGSTEYDEGYLSDLEITVEQLTAVLQNPLFQKECSFYYSSSW